MPSLRRPSGRARMFVLALTLLISSAAGCGVEGSTAATRAGAFVPAPEMPPIRRLGRWNGTTFVPVTAGSVRAGDVDVLVHGWLPGYADAVARHPGLLAWSPEAVDARGAPAMASFLPLAAALTATDPGSTVLAYSWIDGSATGADPLDARLSEARTDVNGQRLAVALETALVPGFEASGGRLHLIGHSHGAKVVTVAALALPRPPAQITLLDSPENALANDAGAANHLADYLPLLPLGRGPGRTFVDSYRSEYGEAYHGDPGLGSVVDVHLLPAQYPLTALSARHAYPILWYARSVRHPASRVGAAWSPPEPGPRADAYVQDWLRSRGGVQRARELDLVDDRGATISAPVHAPLTALVLRGDAAGGRRPDGVALSSPGARIWQASFTRSNADLAVAFDYRFLRSSSATELTLWVDGSERFASVGSWAGDAGRHAVVALGDLSPGNHVLTAVLTAGSGAAALGSFTLLRRPGVSVALSKPRPLHPAATVALWVLIALAAATSLVFAGLSRVARRAGSRPRTGRGAQTASWRATP